MRETVLLISGGVLLLIVGLTGLAGGRSMDRSLLGGTLIIVSFLRMQTNRQPPEF